ncbi:MAG: helix-turn-helix transcriptional regulator [Candidatus Brocadiae bacterium]|nr:helix-turn-helix transcriptional regulator [Candidatus Brocadiia bacterium]
MEKEKECELKKLGKEIKLARIANDLDQKELGDKIGYSAAAVSHWEAGKRIPSYFAIKKIEETFKIKLGEKK